MKALQALWQRWEPHFTRRRVVVLCVIIGLACLFMLFWNYRSEIREYLVPSVSPLARLERELPVKLGQVSFTDCQVNGQPCVPGSKIHVPRGTIIKAEGLVLPDGWNITQLQHSWPLKDGEPSVDGVWNNYVEGGQMLDQMMVLHGEPNQHYGVIMTANVDSRCVGKDPNKVLFRSQIAAPHRPGEYVIDINLIDMANPGNAIRGVWPPRVPGFPVWRCEIVVD